MTTDDSERRPMNPRVKQLWLTALTSGEYKQARKTLRETRTNYAEVSEDRFCCLGVLCDLAVKEGVLPEPGQDGTGTWMYGGGYWSEDRREYDDDGTWSSLPRRVQDWAELSSPDPVILTNDTLAEFNDSGESFDTIAELIEEVL